MIDNLFSGLTTLQRNLILAIAAIVIYVASTAFSYSILGNTINKSSSGLSSALPTPSQAVAEDPNAPHTAECPLNGSMHTQDAKANWEKRRPLAVMIENHTDARPQSGLSNADVVYEAVAEGGITRFMAVFYCNLEDTEVGPVRSARTYFLDWLSEYNALYAHVGGANTPGPADALGQIITYGIADLNQFSIGFPTYWRDYQRVGRTVATEHTMYSSTQKLWDVGAKKGWTNTDSSTGTAWNASFVPWKFKSDQAGAGSTNTITVPFWQGYGDYTVEWDYNKDCNCYKRFNGYDSNNKPIPHIDFDNKQQLSPKNVVVQFEDETHANDGYENNVHLLYATNGSKGASTGQALFFMDGKVTQGKWIKQTRTSRTKYVDNAGNEIAFDRGQIWIQTVPVGSTVKY